MNPINKLQIDFDVQKLKEWLLNCDLWGEYPQRGLGDSPHKEMTDIWVRYKNPKECLKTGDWSAFTEEHKSEWLKNIPYVKDICNAIMDFTNGSQLGGVLITKLPPKKEISPHTDSGWHASYYDKYYVAIKNKPNARFCFDGIEIDPQEGEVYAFRNDVPHWVINDSDEDRIAMIVCVKQNKYSREGLLCLGQQQQQSQEVT